MSIALNAIGEAPMGALSPATATAAGRTPRHRQTTARADPVPAPEPR
jgi:hypothetical protein